jgi:large subunit ribosomal protein L32
LPFLVFLGPFCYGSCMVVRMRHTRAHTANRRSHHALKAQKLATCECGAVRVSHRACAECGRYRGRVVVDMAAKAKKKAAKAPTTTK